MHVISDDALTLYQGISDHSVEAGLFLRAINRKAAKEKNKEDIFVDESAYPKIVTAKQNIKAIEGALFNHPVSFAHVIVIPRGTRRISKRDSAQFEIAGL